MVAVSPLLGLVTLIGLAAGGLRHREREEVGLHGRGRRRDPPGRHAAPRLRDQRARASPRSSRSCSTASWWPPPAPHQPRLPAHLVPVAVGTPRCPTSNPCSHAVTARLRPLEIAANEAWWLASTAVSDEHERRRVSTDIALRDALGDVSTFGQVRDALAQPVGRRGPPHPPPARGPLRPDAAASGARPTSGPSSSSSRPRSTATFNAFRGRIDGEPVDDNTIADDPAGE